MATNPDNTDLAQRLSDCGPVGVLVPEITGLRSWYWQLFFEIDDLRHMLRMTEVLPERLICKTCLEHGLTSAIYVTFHMNRKWRCPIVFYDTSGARHHHDPNASWTGYCCTNEHSWDRFMENKCPVAGCEWKASDDPSLVGSA